MNKLYTLLVSAFLLVASNQASAQCTDEFLQGTSISNGSGFNWGDSFFAPCTGTLEYVEFYAGYAGTVDAGTLSINPGDTYYGPAIYTQNFSSFSVGAGQPVRVNLTGALNLTAGLQYTFVMYVSGVEIIYYPAFGAHPGCSSYQDGWSSYQHNFKISVLSATGTQEITPSLSASLYPNPSNGKFKVLCDDASMFKCEVIDQLGKNVLSTTVQKDLSDELDMTSFPKGLYFVRLTNETGSCTKKLMID